MTDLDPKQAARDDIARKHFLVLNFLRLSGTAMAMFGFLCLMHKLTWIEGQLATLVGGLFASVGLVQAIVLPRIFIRAWRTPPSQ